MNCQVCKNHHSCIKNVPIFSTLNNEEISQIHTLINHLKFPKKTIIYNENDQLDKILIVRSGKIKLVRYGLDGEEILLDILMPGDLYGGDNIFANSYLSENVITMEDCFICTIKNEDLKKLILTNPQIGLKIIEYMNSIIANQKAILEIISIKDAYKRLSSFLLERSRRLNSNTIEITQEEIGNAINLTKETVNRKISQLQNEKIINVLGQKNILILDKKRLENANILKS